MADLQLSFGSDLTVDATGDIALVSGTQEGQERVYRRLLTNPGEYVWEMGYGAGLARFIGRPMAKARILAVTRRQMHLESVVAQNPPPKIDVIISPNGTAVETISYVDADTGSPVPLTLPIGS